MLILCGATAATMTIIVNILLAVYNVVYIHKLEKANNYVYVI